MMKKFGISGQAMAIALMGAAAFGAFAYGPEVFSTADAKPITIEAPLGAPLSFADLIEQVSPAVVSVNVVTERKIGASTEDMDQFLDRFRDMPGFEEFMERRREDEEDGPETQEARSLGSGFFITASGFAVTNNHVVADATEIQIVTSDGEEYDAELVGRDPETDLAVIKVKKAGTYPYVNFADSTTKLRKGDWVVALGNPFGLGGTATAGILSADGRDLGSGSQYTDFLQIDASINRGNSGGPSFDLQGRVIGVNTAIFSPTGGSVGIGFAIPAELAKRVTDQLIKSGKVVRGYLGVSIQDLTEDMAESQGLPKDTEGAIVAQLVDGGPAEESGIRRGDIIQKVNGIKAEDATSVTRQVGRLPAGSVNSFEVLRGGVKKTVSVKVGERPADLTATTITRPDQDEPSTEGMSGSSDILGGAFKPLDADAREAMDLNASEKGVIVTKVDRNGPLSEAGLLEGMAILELNNTAVGNVKDMELAVEAAKRAGRTKVLMVVRVGKVTTFRTIDLSETDE